MNEPAPLAPDAVDALLSADFDGELEAAARDLGLSASAARAQLAATPGVDARRIALARARDLISSRPPIEASAEDRLVAAALAGDELANARARRGRTERQWRILVATGSVAAAVAVIVGIATFDTTSKQQSSDTAAVGTRPESAAEQPDAAKGSDGPSLTTSGAGAGAGADFGDVSDPDALRLPAQNLLKRANPEGTVATGQSTSAPRDGSVPLPANDAAYLDSGLRALSVSPACTAERLRAYDIADTPALGARGTVDGAPVVILIYDGGGNPYADVIRVSDCTRVRRQPLG